MGEPLEPKIIQSLISLTQMSASIQYRANRINEQSKDLIDRIKQATPVSRQGASVGDHRSDGEEKVVRPPVRPIAIHGSNDRKSMMKEMAVKRLDEIDKAINDIEKACGNIQKEVCALSQEFTATGRGRIPDAKKLKLEPYQPTTEPISPAASDSDQEIDVVN